MLTPLMAEDRLRQAGFVFVVCAHVPRSIWSVAQVYLEHFLRAVRRDLEVLNGDFEVQVVVLKRLRGLCVEPLEKH